MMETDVGWSDFGAYAGGGKALGHPTPNIDRIAKEGVTFTSWYGQSSLFTADHLVHHRPHPDPLGTFCCCGPGMGIAEWK